MGHGVIALRPVTAEDAERLLEWRNDPETRAASFAGGEVDAATHAEWLRRKLADCRCTLRVVLVDGEPAGQVRLDLDDKGDAAVSIALAPSMRGRGLAVAVLTAAEAVAHERGAERLVARVKPGNERSLAAFRRAGYIECRRTSEAVTLQRDNRSP